MMTDACPQPKHERHESSSLNESAAHVKAAIRPAEREALDV
jgi:hypothetical protein